jgi:RNA polymerase sigma-70 factor (ECF subfamily)
MPTVTDSGVNLPPATDFDRIFRDHYQFVYRTAYGVTGCAEDAADILQTIFLRLVSRKTPPDLQRNPKAYLYRAAVNLSLNTIRNRRRDMPADDLEQLPLETQTAESENLEDLHDRLYRAMASLDEKTAQMLILRYVHNYTDVEIARLLGTSRVVIAVRLSRSRARLKKLILKEEQHS